MDIAKFLRIVFLYNTSGGCFWQSYHGTVKSAGVPVLWFRASTCFRFWSKTFTKRCTNNSLLSCDKTISSLLELIGHMLLISEYVLENINCFRFWWKLTQSIAQITVISRVKILSSPAFCGWSGVFNFRLCSQFADRFRSEIILPRNDLSRQNAECSGITCPHCHQNGTIKVV